MKLRINYKGVQVYMFLLIHLELYIELSLAFKHLKVNMM